MRRIIAVGILLSVVSLGYSQDKTEVDYDELVALVRSGDTTHLGEKIGDFDINASDHSDQLPLLYYACSTGDSTMVAFLFSKGAEPNVISRYGTPAHWAGQKGHMGIVSMLLDHGYNPRIEEMSYWVDQYQPEDTLTTAWMPKLVAWLLKNGTDYSNYSYMEYTDPSDPLLITAAINHDETGELLLAKELINRGLNVNLVDKRGLTALLCSVQSLQVDGVSLLLEEGADPNMPLRSERFYKLFSDQIYHDNLTPLHYLLFWIELKPEMLENDRPQVLQIIKLLKNAGADVNVKTLAKQQSVLDVAEEIGDKKIIRLLKKG